jgi:hypothetical protein
MDGQLTPMQMVAYGTVGKLETKSPILIRQRFLLALPISDKIPKSLAEKWGIKTERFSLRQSMVTMLCDAAITLL